MKQNEKINYSNNTPGSAKCKFCNLNTKHNKQPEP